MKVLVNGEPRSLPERATVADVVADLGRDPARPGAAVVVNGEVVPHARWDRARVDEQDRVEVVAAAQGG